MKFEATVKVVNSVQEGVSRSTGNPYKYQSVILEAQDGEHSARWLASMGTKQVESFAQQGIKVGDRVIVDLSFQTAVNNNNFVNNKVYVNEIVLVGNLPQVQVPTV